MTMLLRCTLFIIFICGGIVQCTENDVDFGLRCNFPLNGYCEVNLDIECDYPDNPTGVISSPGFPLQVTDSTKFGKYSLVIKTSCESKTTLQLDWDNFLIGPPANSFTVGKGGEVDTINGDIIDPVLHGGDMFPNEAQILKYESSGSSMWMEVDVSFGNFWFYITYTVTSIEVPTTEPTIVTSEPTEGTTVITTEPSEGTTETETEPTISTTEMTIEPTEGTMETTGPTEITSEMTTDPTEGTSETTVELTEGATESTTELTDGTSEVSTEPTEGTTESATDSTESSTKPTTTVSTEGTTTITQTTFSTTQTSWLCNQIDIYNVTWTTNIPETVEKDCSEGVTEATGKSYWTCGYENGQYKFINSQPDYSKCQSRELIQIINSVQNSSAEITAIWKRTANFTSRKDAYYGHEIFQILTDVVVDLLDRMQNEMNGILYADPIEHLTFQINSSYYGTETMNHLITNDAQWDQLANLKRGDEGMLKLLEVSNDIGFRLSDVSKLAEQSILCEISFENVTISSSYWDGHFGTVYDCDLIAIPSQETLFRFPTDQDGKYVNSYILLPNTIKENPYKASGVLIAASNLVKRLLPGLNNSQGKQEKEVNSPLISYTLYDPEASTLMEVSKLPDGSNVQLIFEHYIGAKYPPVQTIHRDLDDGEEPSTVIGSSLCSFLSLNQMTKNQKAGSKEIPLWEWDNEGCRVELTNKTHTICVCNHLTGFANLMDFHNYIALPELSAMSLACTILSIIGLCLTLTILTLFRYLKMIRTFLTQNLCVTLVISYLMILITLDKKYLHLDEVTCAVMGILLHYILLASFMWMLLEGFQLYRMTVDVFDAWNRKSALYYAIVAYSAPFLIVGITVLIANSLKPIEDENMIKSGIIQVYSGDETCWLVGERWMWAFGGPVAVILFANCLFLFSGVRSSCKLVSNSKAHQDHMIGGMRMRVISLTFLLGLTWITGFLLYSESVAVAYIFTIANGLQGVVIFIDCCVLNKKIRHAAIATIKCLPKDKWNTTTFNERQQTVNSVIRDSSKDSSNISNTSNLSDKSNSNDSTAHLSLRIRW